MDAKEYQTAVEKYRPFRVKFPEDRLLWATLALTGEAGETAEVVKKIARDDNGIISENRRTELLHELGDVLWAVTAIANCLDASLTEVMQMNVAKLEDRYKRGVLHGNGSAR